MNIHASDTHVRAPNRLAKYPSTMAGGTSEIPGMSCPPSSLVQPCEQGHDLTAGERKGEHQSRSRRGLHAQDVGASRTSRSHATLSTKAMAMEHEIPRAISSRSACQLERRGTQQRELIDDEVEGHEAED